MKPIKHIPSIATFLETCDDVLSHTKALSDYEKLKSMYSVICKQMTDLAEDLETYGLNVPEKLKKRGYDPNVIKYHLMVLTRKKDRLEKQIALAEEQLKVTISEVSRK